MKKRYVTGLADPETMRFQTGKKLFSSYINDTTILQGWF
jgi:hypothetical protein